MRKICIGFLAVVLFIAFSPETRVYAYASEAEYQQAYKREQARIGLLPISRRQQVLSLTESLLKAANKDDYDSAIDLCKKILELDPKNYLAHIQSAFGYAAHDDFEQANRSLNWVTENFPTSPLIPFAKAVIHARKGDQEAALDELEKAYRSEYFLYLLLGRCSSVWPEDITQNADFQFFTRPNIERVASQFPDANQFSSYSAEFEVSPDILFAATKATFDRNDDPIAFHEDGARFAYTNLARHGILGFPNYKRFVVYVTKSGASDKFSHLYVKLFKYQPDREDGVITLGEPKLKPDLDRDSVQRSVVAFVKDVVKELRREKIIESKDLPPITPVLLGTLKYQENLILTRRADVRQKAEEAQAEALRQRRLAKAEAERQERIKNAREIRTAKRNALLEDFDEEWVDAILDGKVIEGMPAAAVVVSLGEPTTKEIISGSEELWTYPQTKLLFSNSRLSFVVK